MMSTTLARFNEGGRPLFARDADKHLTPAPSAYKPDRFQKYEDRTKLQPTRTNISNEARFKSDEENQAKPGPGQYSEVFVATKKKIPAQVIATADRKLLTLEMSE